MFQEKKIYFMTSLREHRSFHQGSVSKEKRRVTPVWSVSSPDPPAVCTLLSSGLLLGGVRCTVSQRLGAPHAARECELLPAGARSEVARHPPGHFVSRFQVTGLGALLRFGGLPLGPSAAGTHDPGARGAKVVPSGRGRSLIFPNSPEWP